MCATEIVVVLFLNVMFITAGFFLNERDALSNLAQHDFTYHAQITGTFFGEGGGVVNKKRRETLFRY